MHVQFVRRTEASARAIERASADPTANTLKSFRENVKQEPTDELLGGERHGLMAAFVTGVLPAKPNLPVVQPEQPVVRDSKSMGGPCDGLEDLLPSRERRLGGDLPIY